MSFLSQARSILVNDIQLSPSSSVDDRGDGHESSPMPSRPLVVSIETDEETPVGKTSQWRLDIQNALDAAAIIERELADDDEYMGNLEEEEDVGGEEEGGAGGLSASPLLQDDTRTSSRSASIVSNDISGQSLATGVRREAPRALLVSPPPLPLLPTRKLDEVIAGAYVSSYNTTAPSSTALESTISSSLPLSSSMLSSSASLDASIQSLNSEQSATTASAPASAAGAIVSSDDPSLVPNCNDSSSDNSLSSNAGASATTASITTPPPLPRFAEKGVGPSSSGGGGESGGGGGGMAKQGSSPREQGENGVTTAPRTLTPNPSPTMHSYRSAVPRQTPLPPPSHQIGARAEEAGGGADVPSIERGVHSSVPMERRGETPTASASELLDRQNPLLSSNITDTSSLPLALKASSSAPSSIPFPSTISSPSISASLLLGRSGYGMQQQQRLLQREEEARHRREMEKINIVIESARKLSASVRSQFGSASTPSSSSSSSSSSAAAATVTASSVRTFGAAAFLPHTPFSSTDSSSSSSFSSNSSSASSLPPQPFTSSFSLSPLLPLPTNSLRKSNSPHNLTPCNHPSSLASTASSQQSSHQQQLDKTSLPSQYEHSSDPSMGSSNRSSSLKVQSLSLRPSAGSSSAYLKTPSTDSLNSYSGSFNSSDLKKEVNWGHRAVLHAPHSSPFAVLQSQRDSVTAHLESVASSASASSSSSSSTAHAVSSFIRQAASSPSSPPFLPPGSSTSTTSQRQYFPSPPAHEQAVSPHYQTSYPTVPDWNRSAYWKFSHLPAFPPAATTAETLYSSTVATRKRKSVACVPYLPLARVFDGLLRAKAEPYSRAKMEYAYAKALPDSPTVAVGPAAAAYAPNHRSPHHTQALHGSASQSAPDYSPGIDPNLLSHHQYQGGWEEKKLLEDICALLHLQDASALYQTVATLLHEGHTLRGIVQHLSESLQGLTSLLPGGI